MVSASQAVKALASNSRQNTQLLGGTVIESEGITVSGLVPPGHKVATRAIAVGEGVRRYDQIIGHAT